LFIVGIALLRNRLKVRFFLVLSFCITLGIFETMIAWPTEQVEHSIQVLIHLVAVVGYYCSLEIIFHVFFLKTTRRWSYKYLQPQGYAIVLA